VPSPPLDVLAIAAHRDDVEQTCGGTLLKMAQLGRRTGILDLTQGELGTRGTADDREREAADAARILRVSWRQALDIPDGRVENTWENRLKVARVIRELRPRVVILPYWKGRHPDHYTASVLGYEACFLAGLAKLETDRRDPVRTVRPRSSELRVDFLSAEGTQGTAILPPVQEEPVAATAHRPFKIVYATMYYDLRPTFVVDISDQFETRLQSLMAYKSQFIDQEAAQGIFPAQAEIRPRVEAMARFYGMLGGVTYAEPFLQKEVGLVEGVTLLPVKSI
jgi:N-acetylglucosamine malate deacetylase 1